MTENGDRTDGAPSLQQLLLAGVGWVSEGLEAADAFADDLARQLGADRDQVRTAVRDTIASWRREAERLGARGDEITERAVTRFGVARREAVDDLELRVAQLEHRLRLLEGARDTETTP